MKNCQIHKEFSFNSIRNAICARDVSHVAVCRAHHTQNSGISALKCCVETDRSHDNLALAAIEPICLPPLNYRTRRAKKTPAVSKLSQTFAITLFSRIHVQALTYWSVDQYVNDPANVSHTSLIERAPHPEFRCNGFSVLRQPASINCLPI